MNVYVVVGFKISRVKSVYYRKCNGIEELKKAVEESFTKADADFISIRRIRKAVDT